MRSKIGAGVVAGLVAGIVLGGILQGTRVASPDGGQASAMTLLARLFGQDSPGVGWLVHFINCAIIGALFGWWVGPRAVKTYGTAIGFGLLFGVAWWLVAGLILTPLLNGTPALSAPLAVSSLVGYLIFGVIMGAVYKPLATARVRVGRPFSKPA